MSCSTAKSVIDLVARFEDPTWAMTLYVHHLATLIANGDTRSAYAMPGCWYYATLRRQDGSIVWRTLLPRTEIERLTCDTARLETPGGCGLDAMSVPLPKPW